METITPFRHFEIHPQISEVKSIEVKISSVLCETAALFGRIFIEEHDVGKIIDDLRLYVTLTKNREDLSVLEKVVSSLLQEICTQKPSEIVSIADLSPADRLLSFYKVLLSEMLENPSIS